MREILFRGKRIDNGEWAYGAYSKYDVIQADDGNFWNVEKPSIINFNDECLWCEVIPETIGQYTGLTDCRGLKVFEGDIVQIYFLGRTTRHLVEFDDEYRCGWFPFACGDGCGCCETDTYSPSDAEVIGNIHDNPELMKGGASDA